MHGPVLARVLLFMWSMGFGCGEETASRSNDSFEHQRHAATDKSNVKTARQSSESAF